MLNCYEPLQSRDKYLIGFSCRVHTFLHSSFNKYTLLDVLPDEKAGRGRVQEVIDLLIVYLNK